MLNNNTKLFAVCGKGGTGKTASIAMMARAFYESGKAGRLLLIDADPAMGLLSALGAKAQRTMGEIREEIIKTAKKGSAEEKSQIGDMVDYMTFEALAEMDDYALLAMGRTETLGCFCPVNTLLRSAIETLSNSFDTILIDGEAGLEQISRQVVKRIDTLMIVSDPSSRGIETAEMIKKMIEVDKVMDCKRLGLIFNRVRGHENILEEAAKKIGIELLGIIPFDENIAEHDLVGKPITDLPKDSSALCAYCDMVVNVLL
jgi:CO dehydrogenase maturation factor